MNSKTAKLIRKMALAMRKNRKGFKADKKEYLALNWKERTKAKAEMRSML